MNRVLVIGSINIDKTYELEHFAEPGETVKSLKYRTAWGGKGLNQAIAMSKAGADSALAGQVGADDFESLKSLCEGFGLDMSLVRVSDAPTGHAIIQIDQSGQNCIIAEPGANGLMAEDTIRRAIEGFGQGDILLLQNEVGLMPEIIRMGSGKGMTVVLNPSPVTSEISEWPLELVKIFIVNEIEGAALSGESDPEKMLETLRNKFPEAAVLLTLGEDGAMYGSETETVRVCAVKTNAVDTTAAGDTFSGYFLSGLLRGISVRGSLELAARASAITVSRPGAAESIPRLEEL